MVSQKIANWSNLVTLYKLESASLLKLSKLNEVAISPKPIERQKVSICLRIFCEETHTALITHPGMEGEEGREDTAGFIKKVLMFWKIMNVKGIGADIRHNDEMEAVVSDPNDQRLDFLMDFGNMSLKMKSGGKNRTRQLTRDTALALHQTCHGIVELCRHLLATSHKYVAIGKFTSDPLEKSFSKLRQGSGGTYFITVQQILEKLNIMKTSLLLSLNVNIDGFNLESGHYCPHCSYTLDEKGTEIFDNLVKLEESLTLETKMSLLYIAGYVTRNNMEQSEEELLGVTTFYHQKFGSYTDKIDRGQLNIPTDTAAQWTFLSFIMFNTVKENVCRNSLSSILMMISEYYSLGINKQHARILSNIFLKNHCLKSTPSCAKETSLKALKLAS